MEKWEKALNKFLERYSKEEFYEGAIACGSYVSGNNNEFSDIDVHIVLKRDNPWRERGNLEIDGFLIEYFANPVNKYEQECEEEKNDFSCCTASMFKNGKIIEDKYGNVEKLKEIATKCFNSDVRTLTEFELLSSKYGCWDKFDELKVTYSENRDSFYLVYFEVYKRLVTFLTRVRKLREVTITKLDKMIDNKSFKENYGVKDFFCHEDEIKIRNCMVLDTKENMMNKITDFYNYVMEVSGGFDINKFVLRSEVK